MLLIAWISDRIPARTYLFLNEPGPSSLEIDLGRVMKTLLINVTNFN
jgi:hypothetical protein